MILLVIHVMKFHRKKNTWASECFNYYFKSLTEIVPRIYQYDNSSEKNRIIMILLKNRLHSNFFFICFVDKYSITRITLTYRRKNIQEAIMTKFTSTFFSSHNIIKT